MADHPLRPAIDRRLGEPLPHQLANRTRANPPAIKSFASQPYPVLAQVSLSYSEPKGMFPRVTHPSAAPVLLQALDLHVLSLPPAFVLSQDQTLKFIEIVDARLVTSMPLTQQGHRILDEFQTHPPQKRSAKARPPHGGPARTPSKRDEFRNVTVSVS